MIFSRYAGFMERREFIRGVLFLPRKRSVSLVAGQICRFVRLNRGVLKARMKLFRPP